jgi:hypothetical protein
MRRVGLAVAGVWWLLAGCNAIFPNVQEVRLVSDTNDTRGPYQVRARVLDLAGVTTARLLFTGVPLGEGTTTTGTVDMHRLPRVPGESEERFSGGIPGFTTGTTVRYAVEVCNHLGLCSTEPSLWPDGEAFAFVVGTLPSHPLVTAVAPPRGPTAGGIRVEVTGEDFRPGMQVFFSSTRAENVEVLRSTLASCILPPGSAGRADVAVRNPDGQVATLRNGFLYYDTPRPDLVTPDHGPTSGGTAVLIEGAFFPEGARVTFQGRHARHVVVLSDVEIRCDTPPGNPGFADVTVIHPEGGEGTLQDGYRYVPPPRVDAVNPPEGPDFGGQEVTVRGDYFDQGASVTVGGEPCTGVIFVSPQELVCTVPAGTPGSADVEVTNSDGQSGVLPGGYYYSGPPVIVAVDPPEGPLAAGQDVVILGAGFLQGLVVQLGGQGATVVQHLGRDRVTVRVPAAPPPLDPPPDSGTRPVTVRVVNPAPDGRSAELVDGYLYVWPPVVRQVDPPRGPTTGGTSVVLTGRFFRPIRGSPLSVAFDGAPGTALQVVSATELRVTTPAGDPGYADVSVQNHPLSVGVGASLYYYVPPPRPTQVVPPDGPTFGGETVTVVGEYFQPGAVVTFDGAPCSVVEVAPDGMSLTCVTPPGEVGPADVVVINPDGQQGTAPGAYVYLSLLVRPNGGFAVGYTRTRIVGAGMYPGVTITFGETPAAIVRHVSDREVIVDSPAHAVGVVDVRFRNTDGTGEVAPLAFSYRALSNTSAPPLPREDYWGNDGEAVDLDRDGDLDVVVANGFNEGRDQPAVIFRNRGNGTFDMEPFSPAIFSTRVSVGDVTGDGFADVLLAVTGGDVVQPGGAALYVNDGAGRLSPTFLPNPGTDAWEAQIVDLTGDGLNDIFILNIGCPDRPDCEMGTRNADTFLVNLGGGVFEDRSYQVPNHDGLVHDHKLATWDLDGNGFKDIVIVVDNKEFPAPPGRTRPNQHRVLMNHGNGFREVVPADFAALVGNVWGIAVGDLDGDGHADLALPSIWPQQPSGISGLTGTPGSAIVMMGDAAGGFRRDDARLGVGILDEFTANAVMHDLDQDGDQDLFYCNAYAPSRLFINKGDGTFIQAPSAIPPGSPEIGDVVPGDFDGDGDIDLFVTINGQDELWLAVTEP